MATGDQVTITQIGDTLDHVRLWDQSANGGAGEFVDLDAESKTVAGVAKDLIGQPADFLCIGDSATFAYIGFLPDTAGDYGAVKLQYSASGSYSITGVNQGTKTFTIAESKASQFTDGTHFTITGSTGNDGTYTVDGDATGSTNIVVDQAIPDATVDGTISTIWTNITSDVKVDSTSAFSQRGYFAFSIPGDWGLRTNDSISAYWVRLSVASVTTMATMFHMMRSLVIDKVMQFPNTLGDVGTRYTRNINCGIGKKDRVYKGPRKAWLDMTPVSIIGSELNMLLDWEIDGPEVYIEDSRASSPISFTNDSFYPTLTGRLVKMPDGMKSMEKMVDTDYRIHFEIDAYTSLSTTLGLSV